MSPTIVCFDLGGVVVRICRSFAQACEAAGLPAPDPAVLDAAELRSAREALHARYQTGEIHCDAYFEGFAAHSAGLYTAREVRAIHDAVILGEYAGVAELVRTLNAVCGVATACLSNTNARHWQAMLGLHEDAPLSRSPALDAIQHRFASHEMGVAKPSPEIHRRFERSLGVAPDRVIFFDDLAENIDAARRCGWRAHQVDHTGDTAAQIRECLACEGVAV